MRLLFQERFVICLIVTSVPAYMVIAKSLVTSISDVTVIGDTRANNVTLKSIRVFLTPVLIKASVLRIWGNSSVPA